MGERLQGSGASVSFPTWGTSQRMWVATCAVNPSMMEECHVTQTCELEQEMRASTVPVMPTTAGNLGVRSSASPSLACRKATRLQAFLVPQGQAQLAMTSDKELGFVL